MPTLRRARPEEHALLSELAFRSKGYWGYDPSFMEACRAELTYTPEDLSALYFGVVEEDEGVLGFHALGLPVGGTVELEALFVEPRSIGRGYGRALIEDAKRRARALGAHTMIIQGDPHAERFYLEAGARRIGERESESVPDRYLPLFSIAL